LVTEDQDPGDESDQWESDHAEYKPWEDDFEYANVDWADFSTPREGPYGLKELWWDSEEFPIHEVSKIGYESYLEYDDAQILLDWLVWLDERDELPLGLSDWTRHRYVEEWSISVEWEFVLASATISQAGSESDTSECSEEQPQFFIAVYPDEGGQQSSDAQSGSMESLYSGMLVRELIQRFIKLVANVVLRYAPYDHQRDVVRRWERAMNRAAQNLPTAAMLSSANTAVSHRVHHEAKPTVTDTRQTSGITHGARLGAPRLEKRPDWEECLAKLEKFEKLVGTVRYTAKGAAALVGVSLSTLRYWAKRRDSLADGQ